MVKQIPDFCTSSGEYYQIKGNPFSVSQREEDPDEIEVVEVGWGEAKVLPYSEEEKIVVQPVWRGKRKYLRIGEFRGRRGNTLGVAPLEEEKKSKLKELLGLEEIEFWGIGSETKE